jgi:hypothetical protein
MIFLSLKKFTTRNIPKHENTKLSNIFGFLRYLITNDIRQAVKIHAFYKERHYYCLNVVEPLARYPENEAYLVPNLLQRCRRRRTLSQYELTEGC